MRWFLALCLFTLSFSLAQTLSARRESGVLYVSLTDVAQALGYTTVDGQASLTVQTPTGALVIYDRSPDIDWTPSQGASEQHAQSISAPSFVDAGEWFVPADLFYLFDFSPEARALVLPDGRSFLFDLPREVETSYQVVDMGAGVKGLSFYQAGIAGKETVSLLLLDLARLPQVFPDQQSELAPVIERFSDGYPIYFVVTARAESIWQPQFRFVQSGRALEYQYPANITLLEGDASRVNPEQPVSGILVLPAWIDLRQPLEVSWAGMSAKIQFE